MINSSGLRDNPRPAITHFRSRADDAVSARARLGASNHDRIESVRAHERPDGDAGVKAGPKAVSFGPAKFARATLAPTQRATSDWLSPIPFLQPTQNAVCHYICGPQ